MLKFKPYLKLAIYLVTAVIIVLLGLRFWVYLTKSPMPDLLGQVCDVVLYPIPGELHDVNLAQAGFDFHAPLGIGFYLLLAWGLSFVVDKLVRRNWVQTLSGIIDIWAGVMISLIILGYALISFGLNPGSSIITDLAMNLITKASHGSVVAQPHLMSLFLFISVFLFNILTDYLLQLRFAILYFELGQSTEVENLQAADIASNWGANLSSKLKEFGASLNLIEVFRKQQLHVAEALKDSADPAKVVTPWKAWTAGYVKHKQSLASYIES